MNNLFFSDLIISKDLTSLDSFAYMGLIGLVIASLIMTIYYVINYSQQCFFVPLQQHEAHKIPAGSSKT